MHCHFLCITLIKTHPYNYILILSTRRTSAKINLHIILRSSSRLNSAASQLHLGWSSPLAMEVVLNFHNMKFTKNNLSLNSVATQFKPSNSMFELRFIFAHTVVLVCIVLKWEMFINNTMELLLVCSCSWCRLVVALTLIMMMRQKSTLCYCNRDRVVKMLSYSNHWGLLLN